MQLRENTLFHDRYLLAKLLGRGGFSEVWLVEDTKIGNKKMALKIYAPGYGLDADGVKLFSDEFLLVCDLNHTHLLRPSHYDVCDRSPYLVMPFCERGSADKLAGRITEEKAWKFLHDVASGLAYLHEQEPPVIHQDIKPDNVLVNNQGNYLITDFGVSVKIRSTLRKSMGKVADTFGGTIAYMAPERFSKDNMPVKAGDIWALGATLFELMTGNTPFGNHGGLIQKSGAEIPYIPSSYSTELKEIVLRCLSSETWDRPTAMTLKEYAGKVLKGEKCSWDSFIGNNRSGKKNTDESDIKFPEMRQRNKFTSFWIWLMIILNGLVACILTANVLISGFEDISITISSFAAIANLLSAIMLWKWLKPGYWLFVASSLVTSICLMIDDSENGIILIPALAGLGILYGILNLKRNNISCWGLMDNSFQWKKNKTLYWIFIIVSALLWMVGGMRTYDLSSNYSFVIN
jgi:serine/threonine protein kinase